MNCRVVAAEVIGMDGCYTRLATRLLITLTPRFVVVVVAAAAQFRLRVQSQDETHTTDETDIVPVFRGSSTTYYLPCIY